MSEGPHRVMPRTWPARLGPLLLVVLVGLLVAACVGGGASSLAPGVTAPPTPTPPAGIPLAPAPLNPDPFSLLAWLFTPIFQAFFITLVLLDRLTGNIVVAIILLTLLIKILLIPIFRRQLVSTRRMQLVAPELKEIQRRYKGDRVKIQQATAQLYKERGVSAVGCLPIFLQMLLLIPLYSVFSQGLTNFDPQAMLDVFGFRILDLACDAAPVFLPGGHVANPCLNSIAFGVNWGVPEVFLGSPGALFSGLSFLAIISSLTQLVASRMTMPAATATDDPNSKTQRQMAIFLPVHLADLRQHPPGRPVPVLDRVDPLLDRPAVPHHRVGWDVPDLRLDATVCRGPSTALPGRRTNGADVPVARGGSPRAINHSEVGP